MKCTQRVCGRAKVRPRKPNESQWPPRHNKSKRLPLVRNLRSLDIGRMSDCLLNVSNRGGPCEPLKPHITFQHQEMFDSHEKWQVACNACIILALVLRWGVLKATSPVATVQVETHIVQPNFIQTFDRVWFYIHKHETPCKVCSSI